MDGKKIKETIEVFQDQIEWIKAITDTESEGLCEGCIEYFETAIEVLEKQLPKKPDADNDWIPCSERLPEDGTYLCTLDGELLGEQEPFTGMCGIKNGKWDEEGCVIAWKPLPEPYKQN